MTTYTGDARWPALYVLDCVLEFERAIRGRTEWGGGPDCHHRIFQGLERIDAIDPANEGQVTEGKVNEGEEDRVEDDETTYAGVAGSGWRVVWKS